MSLCTWFVFPCNLDCGIEGDDPPQTEWSGQHKSAETCGAAMRIARSLVNDAEYDISIIMYYVEGKGLELYGTFGFHPAKNDYDFPGRRADGYVLVRKLVEAVVSKIDGCPKKEAV